MQTKQCTKNKKCQVNSNSVHQIGANGSSVGTPFAMASVMPHFFHPLSMIAGFFIL